MFDFFFFICFCKWIWLICGVLIWGFLCYGFLSVSWCLWACVCTPSSGARRSESHGRFACYGVRTWGSRYRCGVPTHHWGYLHGKLKGRGGGEGKILGRLLENQGSGGQACEEGGVRETLSAWGRHWPQMLHRACSLQRRPQIILPHKSVATGPGRVDGGVEKMAKFHLLLIYTSRFLAPLNRTTVNMNTRSNFGCCLSIFFFCDEILPSSDCLWGKWRKYLFPSLQQKPSSFQRRSAQIQMSMMVTVRRLFIPRHSLAWRWRRLLLLTQGALGGLKVAVATGGRFRGRFGASLWVLAVFYISHSLHIATTAHPSTGDLSPFASPTT